MESTSEIGEQEDVLLDCPQLAILFDLSLELLAQLIQQCLLIGNAQLLIGHLIAHEVVKHPRASLLGHAVEMYDFLCISNVLLQGVPPLVDEGEIGADFVDHVCVIEYAHQLHDQNAEHLQ